ncbi:MULTISPECIES: sensor histidine kinase [Giesbergeria]|uniref:histidine kinase n=1 Tax=Giesbergeria sinuosa TaxID=80883 RepID=A0ABV9QGI6_9BURK
MKASAPSAHVASRHRTPRHAVMVYGFSLFVLVVVWTTVVTVLYWQWQATQETELRQNINMARAIKEHTLRVLETMDQAVLRLQTLAAEHKPQPQDYLRTANETGLVPDIMTQLSFVDAEGYFQGSNLDPDGKRSGKISLKDREHIRVHLQPREADPTSRELWDGLFISKPLQGRVSGQWTIQLSRKVTGLDGHTVGVVVASLNPVHLSNVYSNVQLSPGAGLMLAGLDEIIRVRVIDGMSSGVGERTPAALATAILENLDGTIIGTGNDGVERIVGYSRVGNYPLTVISGTTVEEAFSRWRANRNVLLVMSTLASLCVVAFLALFRSSVRELAQSHEALVHSEAIAQQASQAKSEFLAAMSHELRTPLTSIKGFSELIALRSKDTAIIEQAGLISHAATHLNSLLTEILDLARIEANAMPTHPVPVVLHDVLHEVTALFEISALAKALHLHCSVAPGVPERMVTDPLKLKQILNNLLSNAVKFTEQGHIDLHVELDSTGQSLLLHVRDTGPGIAPELHERIFERFRQGNARTSYEHGGTGLGLGLSRGLAQLLGGTLTLQSTTGAGACFTLSLPLVLPEALPTTVAATTSA